MSRRRPARVDMAQQTTTPTPVRGDDPCPGPCNRAFRAAEEQALAEVARAQSHHEQHPDGACDPDCLPDRRVVDHDTPMHPGRPVWCDDIPAFDLAGNMLDHMAHYGCQGRVLSDLAEIPGLATWLTPGRLPSPSDGDVDPAISGGGAEAIAHAPSPSPAWDEIDRLTRWLCRLEDQLRDRLGDAPKSTPTRLMSDAVGYLGRNGAALLAMDDAAGVGEDIMRARTSLVRMAGQDRLVHRLPGTCLRCDRKTLRRNDGDEIVKCRACGACWDWGAYEFLAHAYAADIAAHSEQAGA